ncbi:MAG: twin-arginine translocase subunit TatC [Chloroflexi bacterium]|nr:MAG: twin-arginine translocase subunit TatC [Chloroflexota bacterium]RLC95790.1 MAG: twin-arginine translocase subunit TatC [Chloroflexota bacterium]
MRRFLGILRFLGIGRKKERDLTLRGHLEELRERLIKSILAVVAATGISFVFAKRIFEFFTSRAEDVDFVYIEVTEMVGVYMKVCLYAGVVLALPVIIYQFVMFVHPALTRSERRYLYALLPGVLLFFFAGAAFTYYVFLPPALKFLIDFPLTSGVAEPEIRIGNYVSVVARLLLVMGLIFELPLVLYFLTKIGVVTPEWLAKWRRFAVVGAFVVAAIVTPTFDPVNQTIVAIPMILLYEVGILLSKLARRGQPAAT